MKRIFSIIFGMLFFFGIASAQDRAFKNLPQQWTLQDCIAYAQQQNIQLHSLKLSVASAEQDLIQSKANRLPGVSGPGHNLLLVSSYPACNNIRVGPVVGLSIFKVTTATLPCKSPVTPL